MGAAENQGRTVQSQAGGQGGTRNADKDAGRDREEGERNREGVRKSQGGWGERKMAGKRGGRAGTERNVDKEGGRTEKGRENGDGAGDAEKEAGDDDDDLGFRAPQLQGYSASTGGRGTSAGRIGEAARLLAGHG